jgi:hypothetical protein
MHKNFTLLIILILLPSNAIMLETSSASIPKPSIPQFTAKFVDHSYYVPTTFSIDPYTGQNVSHPGRTVENKTIEIAIINEPYTPYTDINGTATFYYNIRIKGHYASKWIELYNPESDYLKRSNSDYTVVAFTIGENAPYPILNEVSARGQVDFQVQALLGYTHRGYNPNATNQLDMFPWVFDGETSDWSNTQTVTIDANASTPTPSTSTLPSQNPTVTPLQPNTESDVLVGLGGIEVAVVVLAVVVVLLVFVVVFLRRRAVRNAPP